MTGRPRPQCNRGATLRRVHWSCGFRKRGPGSKRSTGFVRAIPVIRRVRPAPLLLALRQSRYLSVLEAPPINAIEGAFSASIVLIALVVLCDQDLLGRLSFDSVGRALRPKTKSSIQMNGKSCKANPEITRLARQPSGFRPSVSSSSRKVRICCPKTRIRGVMPPPVRLFAVLQARR